MFLRFLRRQWEIWQTELVALHGRVQGIQTIFDHAKLVDSTLVLWAGVRFGLGFCLGLSGRLRLRLWLSLTGTVRRDALRALVLWEEGWLA